MSLALRRALSVLAVGALAGALVVPPAHAEGSDITGHISGSSGEPLMTCVTAYDETWTWTSQGCSDDTGAYAITGLTDGMTYRLQVDGVGDHVGEWAQDAADFDQAESIPAGGVADVSLALGARFEGTLSERDGSGATGVGVFAEGVTNGVSAFGQTDDAGSWSLLVPAGSYRLNFQTPIPQYAVGRTTWATADIFTVTSGEHRRVDDTVLPHGVVTGRVLDAATGAPLAEVCARLVDPAISDDWADLGSGCTDSAGRYSLTATRPGTFVVRFQDTLDRGYAPSFSGGSTRATVAPRIVVTDTSTTTVAGRMRLGGSVVGRVVDAATGSPIAHMCPDLYRGRSTEKVAVSLSTCSNAQGYYSVKGVPSTGFTVSLRPEPHTPYAFVWAGGASDQSRAKLFSLTAPASMGLGATGLPAPGIVTGVVKDNRGQPVAGAWVDLSGHMVGRMGHGDAPFEAQTDDAGVYTIYAPPGSYVPIVYQDGWDSRFAPEWSGNASSRESGTPLTVRSGLSRSWSPWLAPGSSVQATIVAADGSPTTGSVGGDIYSLTGEWLGGFWAPAGGTFTASSLPAVPVILTADLQDPRTGAVTTVYFDGATDRASATPVSLLPRRTTTVTWHLP